MDIKEYYLNEFRSDLVAFMGDRPVPYFGHSWSQECVELTKLPTENLPPFIVCLYFTVLIDQAMHCHYHGYYYKFKELTRYPKFCVGLSQFQKNPREILLIPIERNIVRKDNIAEILDDGMSLFVKEVVSFLKDYMPNISPKELFDKLLYDPDVQIPKLLIMLDNNMKDDIVCMAYEALRNAVDLEFPM